MMMMMVVVVVVVVMMENYCSLLILQLEPFMKKCRIRIINNPPRLKIQ